MQSKITRHFVVILTFLLAVETDISRATVIDRPLARSPNESCPLWVSMISDTAPSLPTLLDNGLCRGEIFGAYTILRFEGVICTPTETSPEVISSVVAKYIKEHTDYAEKHSISEITFDVLKFELRCNPETR